MTAQTLPTMPEIYDLLYGAVDRYQTLRCTAAWWTAPAKDPKHLGANAWWRSALVFDQFGNWVTLPPAFPEQTLMTYELWLRRNPPAIRLTSQFDGEVRTEVLRGWTWWLNGTNLPLTTGTKSTEMGHDDGSGLPMELRDLLDPSWLLAVLDLEATGTTTHDGRDAIQLRGTLRSTHAAVWTEYAARVNRGPFSAEDADVYDLIVDGERGIILAMTATFQGEVFAKTTLSRLTFDKPIPKSRFAALKDD